ncbi:hypothetical protein WBG78_13410 [Chryseolinea sp. T2]|uniref:hypothetical protein n=1 Tax=Chryseolinea sp. T2 TaxID=3129255 RepID=UPI003076B9BA
MSKGIASAYRLISILSLDVVAGAVICALFFIKVLQTEVSFSLIPLALTVWIIYTADHLMDARRIGHAASSPRHLFHQLQFQRMLVAVGVALLLDLISLLFVSRAVIMGGVFLAFLVVLLIVMQRALPWLREIVVSVLYTCGVLLPSIAQARTSYTIAHSLLFIQFSLVALTNLLILSWLDREMDFKDGLTSFTLIAGKRMSQVMIWTSFTLCMMLTIAQIYYKTLTWPGLVVGAMEAILMLIYVGNQRPDRLLVQRMIGDGVFILPLLYLVW